jgi:hypothetical protein
VLERVTAIRTVFYPSCAVLLRSDDADIDGAMRQPPQSQAKRVASSLQHTINYKVRLGGVVCCMEDAVRHC